MLWTMQYLSLMPWHGMEASSLLNLTSLTGASWFPSAVIGFVLGLWAKGKFFK